MRNLHRSFIVAMALAALSIAGAAAQSRSDAEPSAHTLANASPSPTKATVEAPPKSMTWNQDWRAKNPDPLHRTGDLLEVSIARQTLTVWRDGRVQFRFVISTGRPGYETPTGHYKVLNKAETWWSRQWSVWMPWALRWHGSYFFHQLPHKPGSSVNIGATKLGTPDSHGCIRVNVGDAELLYKWTAVGTPVWIH
jgi:lipoprotein-anchoring transpeptidase ErfK/SrfK